MAKFDNRQPIYTRLNPRPTRSTPDARRILVGSHWLRPDPQASATLRWLKAEGVSK